MRWIPILLLSFPCLLGATSQACADEEILLEESFSGVPVQNAILTRRYGAVVPEEEIAGAELEAGYGATGLFKSIHWRRAYYYRPWYGYYGWYGPRYYVGYGPRFYGYYPPSYYSPYWGGYYRAPYSGYVGFYSMPYVAAYAPPAVFYGGYGGCFYW